MSSVSKPGDGNTRASSGVVVGVDVGGTFTDCIIMDSSADVIYIAKVSSTPEDQSTGVIDAIEHAWPGERWQFDTLVHGTTVATNAVIERRGDAVALVTTQGLRDVLEMRRRDRPHLYGLRGEYRPLVSRADVVEVAERVTGDGVIEAPVQLKDLQAVATRVRAGSYRVVVVSFVNSYANPSNEMAAKAFLRDALSADISVIAGSDITREYREFERTSTAVISAYVQPLVGSYLVSLERKVRARQYLSDVWVVQSNGGRMSVGVAADRSVNTILSGPAAGVVAGQRIAEGLGYRDVVTMDIGGTSVDIAVARDGRMATTAEAEIEFGIPLRLPMIDVHTVGAGGGSIAWIDREGLLRVGPQSAGAIPGPACYGRGGLLPTLTDAHVALGRIGEHQALGSEASRLRVQRELARRALAHLDSEIPGDTEEIAKSVIEVAVQIIAHSIRLATVERGIDPVDLTLVAFGGAGPLHACALMQEVGFRTCVIPRFPGITSALGCIMGDVRHDFIQTIGRPLDQLTQEGLTSIVAAQIADGHALLVREHVDPTSAASIVEADINYDRQTHSVSVPLAADALDPDAIRLAFENVYMRRFGKLFSHAAIILVNLRTSVIATAASILPSLSGVVRAGNIGPEAGSDDDGSPSAEDGQKSREVNLPGRTESWPVYSRHMLQTDTSLRGPAIIEQDDATTIVEPGFVASVTTDLSILIRTESQ